MKLTDKYMYLSVSFLHKTVKLQVCSHVSAVGHVGEAVSSAKPPAGKSMKIAC